MNMLKTSMNTAVTYNYAKYQLIGQQTMIGTHITNNSCSYRLDCLMVQTVIKYWYIYFLNGNTKRSCIDCTVAIYQLQIK